MNSHHPIPPHAQKVFQGKLFSIWQWEQKLYDGSTWTYERAKRNDAAHVTGVLPDGRILLAEDEQPDRPALITPPGGLVEAGESPAQTAKRELLEETGYSVGKLLFWRSYGPGGKVDFRIHSFVGHNLTKTARPRPEAGEKIKPLLLTFDEFLALGNNPKMRDPVIRISLLEAQLDNHKKDKLKRLLYGER